MSVSISGGDYSVARPSTDDMLRAGWHFVARYLRDLDPSNGDKSLTPGELERIKAAGLAVVSNEETTGVQLLGGWEGGIRDARAANVAHLALGAPPSRPIYFSPWDHDPALLTDRQWELGEDYLRGVRSVIGLARIGLYGGLSLVSWAFDRGLITYGWEAAGWHKGRPIDPRSHIVQLLRSPIPGTDVDRAVKLDFGQWGGRTAHPSTKAGSDRMPTVPVLVRPTGGSAVYLKDGESLLHIDTDNLRAYADLYGVPESVIRDAIIDVDPAEWPALQVSAKVAAGESSS